MIGKIILTGGSGCGKTTTIQELKKLEYPTIPEVAEEIIKTNIRNNSNALPWKNRESFQKQVENAQVINFISNRFGFFDRGLPDEIGFREYGNINIPSKLYEDCWKYRYDLVFIFEPNKKYFNNNEFRQESFETSVQYFNYLKKAYNYLEYSPILIKPMELEERVKFILNISNYLL